MKCNHRLSVLFFALMIVPASAQTSRPAEVFEAAGRSSLPAAWKLLGGEWKMAGGRLTGSAAAGAAESTLMLGDATCRDVILEVDLSFAPGDDKTRWCALLVREGGEAAPGVQFTVRADTGRNNGLEIASKWAAPRTGWHVLQTASVQGGVPDGRTRRVRIEAVGHWIRGYVDGKMVIRSSRGNEFGAQGKAALRVSGATVMIDRISIQSLDGAAPGTSEIMRTRPLVIAHRGFSFIAPENTLASYKLAMTAGADMAECDVYLTQDEVPILLHDATFKRTTGRNARPCDLTLQEIKKLDAGKWKSADFTGEPVPTLAETLQLLKGKLRLVIEIKEATIAPKVVECLRETQTEPQDVMIFSFHDKAVQEIARLEPRLPTTWLVDNPGIDDSGWRATIRHALEIRASAIGTSLTHVDPGFVKLAHECGFSVFVWTVNEPQDASYLVNLGVDAIISDRPDMVVSLLCGKTNP